MIYDRQVYESAMEFLKAYRRSVPEQPLFLVVGFYSPHFPFACEEALYRKYQERHGKGVRDMGGNPGALLLRRLSAGVLRGAHTKLRGRLPLRSGGAAGLLCGAVYDRFREAFADRRHLFIYTSTTGAAGQTQNFWKTGPVRGRARCPWCRGDRYPARRVFTDGEPLGCVAHGAWASGREPFEWHRGRAIDFWRPDGGNRWVRVQQMLEWGRTGLAQAAGMRPVQRAWPQAAGMCMIWRLTRMSGRTWRGLWPAGGGDGARDHVPGGDPCGAADGLGPAGRENCFVGQEEIRRLIENEQELCARQKRLTQWGRAKNPEEWARAQICPEAVRGPVETRGDFVDEV